ncbi:hypothetical protein DACRYDRAFT_61596, partial [Dacryopinax primogenitus]
MRKRVQRKDVGEDVWFRFKDSRRAMFHLGTQTYPAKLVDLPSIIESQKTLNSRQLYKTADICQMLLVEPQALDSTNLGTGAGGGGEKSFNLEEFIYPHGITPPLKWVRKRRFRKRINRMTIESVEQEVERLLEVDAKALEVEFDILENVDPDMSDSEFEPRAMDAATPGSAMGEDGYAESGTGRPGEDGEEEEEDEMDMELAAEIDRAFEEEAASDSEEEVGGQREVGESESETGSEEESEEEEYESDESGEEDEEEEEAEEADAGGERQRRRLLAEEIADLERACERKAAEVARAGNPVIKKRLEDVLGKLTRDLEMRRAQREEMRRGREERRRVRREVKK